MKTYIQTSKPIFLLSGFLVIAQFINGILYAKVGYPIASNVWFALAFYWAISWWFIHDSRSFNAGWADKYMDMGMFLYIAGFFVVPYYLFKTRGWKAIFTIGFLVGIYYGAYLTGVFFYLLLNAF